MPEETHAGELSVDDEYVRELVTILFAVVVGFSIDTYADTIFTDSLHEVFSPPWVGIMLVYISIVLSWIGYHFWIIKYSYQTSGVFWILRLFIDIAIVISYAYLLYIIRWIVSPETAPDFFLGIDSAGGTMWFLYAYTLVFILYIINDALVVPNHDPAPTTDDTIPGHIPESSVALLGYIALLVIVSEPISTLYTDSVVVRQWIGVLLGGSIMILWRLWIGIGRDK